MDSNFYTSPTGFIDNEYYLNWTDSSDGQGFYQLTEDEVTSNINLLYEQTMTSNLNSLEAQTQPFESSTARHFEASNLSSSPITVVDSLEAQTRPYGSSTTRHFEASNLPFSPINVVNSLNEVLKSEKLPNNALQSSVPFIENADPKPVSRERKQDQTQSNDQQVTQTIKNVDSKPISRKRKKDQAQSTDQQDMQTVKKELSLDKRNVKKREERKIKKRVADLVNLVKQYPQSNLSDTYTVDGQNKEFGKSENISETLNHCKEIFSRIMEKTALLEKENDKLKRELEEERSGRRGLTKYIMNHKKICPSNELK